MWQQFTISHTRVGVMYVFHFREELIFIKYYSLKSLKLADKTLQLLRGFHNTVTHFLVWLTHHITQNWHYRKCLWIWSFVGHSWVFSSRKFLFNTHFYDNLYDNHKVFLLMDFTWGTLECFLTSIIIVTVFRYEVVCVSHLQML